MSRLKRELYRLPRQGKIAGVCAGIAEHFGFEVWLVRIVFITGLLLSGSLFFVLYVAGWFILDVKPGQEKRGRRGRKGRKKWKEEFSEKAESQIRSHFESHPIEVKEKVWQAGELPKQAIHDIV
ncbi:MAG: phage shock protein C, partial [Phenylobacterium sp.]